MTFKYWLLSFFLIVGLAITAIGAFNSYIDPLWFFHHKNKWNTIQMGFDERQQKTNFITYGSFSYDSLIVGSSRTSFINANNFYPMKAYNYAVSSMAPEEYDPYIQYAKQQKGGDFSNIVIGLDFFGTNQNRKTTFQPPTYYMEQARSWWYPLKVYLSKDGMDRSIQNINLSRHHVQTIDSYNRDNVKHLKRATSEERTREITKQLATYNHEIYGNYKYKNMKQIFLQLKQHNPHARFYVFTTPESEPLFRLMIQKGRWDDYEHWLRDAVDVFGTVYDFTYVNSITKNLANYKDAQHFTPSVGTFIAHRVLNIPDPKIPSDFGVEITKNNIDQVLKQLKAVSTTSTGTHQKTG